MADFTASAIIHRPVHEVFSYITNVENIPEIMPNVVKMVKITEGPLQEGTRFLETRSIRGRHTSTEIEYVEYKENELLTTKSESNGLTILYRYLFSEIEEGTQVELDAILQTTGLKMRLTKGLLVNMIKKEDGNQLVYLKDMLEKE
jgi:uncharacterized protein YndB with AHSA1/START domain